MVRSNALVVLVSVGLGLLGPACKSQRKPKEGGSSDAGVVLGPVGAKVSGRLSQEVRKRGRAMVVRVGGADHVQNNDHVDLVALFPAPKTGEPVTVTVLQNVIVLSAEPAAWVDAPAWDLTVLVLPEEAEILGLARKVGRLHASLRNPGDVGGLDEVARTSVDTLVAGDRAKALLKMRAAVIDKVGSPDPHKLVRRSGPLSGLIPKHGRALSLPLAGLGPVRPGDRVDLLWVATGPRVRGSIGRIMSERLVVLSVDGPDRATLLVVPMEAALLVLAADQGDLTALLRNPEDLATTSFDMPATLETLLTGKRAGAGQLDGPP